MTLETEKWKSIIKLSCIPLVNIDQANRNEPGGFASGCSISYSRKNFILSVSHATREDENWAIELKYLPAKGVTKVHQIGPMNFLKQYNLKSGKCRDVDFSYAAIPKDLVPLYQDIESSGKVLTEIPRITYQTCFDIKPDKSRKYGFCGKVSNKFDGGVVRSSLHTELDMTYAGKDNIDDNLFMFHLKTEQLPNENYWGCSGAPIISNDGSLTSLVVAVDQNIVYGLDLNKYKIALDIECGNINGLDK